MNLHEGLTGETIGRRIAGWRKARGFKAAKDLADAVSSDGISAAVIQNIEAGRKSDMSVSQLLNIAFALRVPPTYLLFPVAAPYRAPDLVGLSDDVREYTSGHLESWTASEFSPYAARIVELGDLDLVRAQRELLMLRHEINRLERSAVIERWHDEQSPPSDAQIESRRQWDTTASRLESYRARAAELLELLEREGWPAEQRGPGDGDD